MNLKMVVWMVMGSIFFQNWSICIEEYSKKATHIRSDRNSAKHSNLEVNSKKAKNMESVY